MFVILIRVLANRIYLFLDAIHVQRDFVSWKEANKRDKCILNIRFGFSIQFNWTRQKRQNIFVLTDETNCSSTSSSVAKPHAEGNSINNIPGCVRTVV